MVPSFERDESNIDVGIPEILPSTTNILRSSAPNSFEGEGGEKRRLDAISHPALAAWLLGEYIGDAAHSPAWMGSKTDKLD